MLDVIIPTPKANLSLVPEAIDTLVDRTDVPVRVIVVADGCTPEDLEPLGGYLRGCAVPWILLQEEQPAYLNGCIRAGIAQLRNGLVAIMRPEVRLLDSKWFGKMQQIILKDHRCGVIDTLPNTSSSAELPVRRQHNRIPDPGCRLAMLRSNFLADIGVPLRDGDPISYLARRAIQVGCSIWHMGGVYYTLMEHEEHHEWRGPLAVAVSSKSPSRMIPGSSSATTTEVDGPRDFGL